MDSSADEVRPVTTLFADIVGSMGLGERLTPGEVKALVGECITRMAGAAEEFGGHVQAFMGDGICVYFGVPNAHEDDPERAALAALRILDIIREYSHDVKAAWGISNFNVRIGLNTGHAAVGLVGSATTQRIALGDATNVAARLEAMAEPGTALVGPDTAKRLTSKFALEPIGPVPVKGRAEQVAAWRLVGVSQRPTVGEPLPFVDREAEIGRLRVVIDDVAEGRGEVLLVMGEAGVGKTRLLKELQAGASDRLTWLVAQCLPYGSEILRGPFASALRSWLDVEERDPEVLVRMRLRSRLSAVLEDDEELVLRGLAALLAVRVDEPERRSAMDEPAGPTSDDITSDVQLAVRRWIEELTRERPVALVLDDMQWADSATRVLAESLLETTERAPFLLAALFRPDPSSEAWPFRLRVMADFAHRAVELPLGPLSEEAARQLADLVLGVESIDAVAKQGIVARAEGNPLYLEELLRSATEAGASIGSRTWTVSARNLLPSSLESLILSRIDTLPEGARGLIQVAAVIGRQFEVRLLAQVLDREVADDIGVLLKADLVRELGRYPELVCGFRHGLVHEAALSTLTTDRLRELHRRVAVALEYLYRDGLEEHVERLAFHFYRSDDQPKAIEYLQQAAERFAAMGDRPRAIELLRRGERLASRIGEEDASKRITARLTALE